MIYRFSDCILDGEQHKLYRNGELIDIEPRVFAVLAYLLERRGELVLHDELFERCWPGRYVSEGTLTRCMSRVRRVIGHSARNKMIDTVYRRGYRFIGEVSELPEGAAAAAEPAEVVPALAGKETEPEFETAPEPLSVPAGVPAAKPADTPDISPAFPAGQAEWRHIAVLSCHCGFDDMLDIEERYQQEQSFRSHCQHCLVPLGGYLAKSQSDNLVFYFGYPKAFEDGARRAVLAGLQLLAFLQQQDSAAGAVPAVPVRIGIHSGPIIIESAQHASSQAPLAAGRTESIAIRLTQQAPVQSVVISAATAKLVRGYFDWQPLNSPASSAVAASAPAPVSAYQVLAERAGHLLYETDTRMTLTPFVGREPELALLYERWIQACEGIGQVVLLSGEPGIGKSRLVGRLKQQIVDEASARLQCHASPYHQNTALFPLIGLLRRVLRDLEVDPAADDLRRIEALAAYVQLPAVETVALLAGLLSLPLPPGYPPPPDISPQQQRRQSLQLLLNLLLVQARRGPFLLVIEDLHWADPSTLEFIDLLVDHMAMVPLLVVLTCRPEFEFPRGYQATLTPLRLDRLNRSQIEQMLWRISGGKTLPAAVISAIAEKTDGIPLFIEEVMRLLLESGQLRETANGFALNAPLTSLSIPPTLQDSLMARLDKLSHGKLVAQWGAVLGREFPYQWLAAVMTLDETLLQQGLEELLRAGLMYQRGLPPATHYIFKHALIRDSAYQSLLKDQCRQIHQRIAGALESAFPDTVAGEPELLARHYQAAGQIGQALVYWQRAGRMALQRSAYQEAIRHLQQGLELLAGLADGTERTRQELELCILLGPALSAARGAGASEAEHVYQRALALCEELGETSQRYTAWFGLWRFYTIRGQLRQARALSEQCLALAQTTHDPERLPGAHYILGASLLLLGEPAQAHAQLARGAAEYDMSRQPVRISRYGFDAGLMCLIYETLALWLLGYSQQALDRSRVALTAAERSAHGYSQMLTHYFVARLHQFRREPDAVRNHAEAVLAICRQQGVPLFEGAAMMLQGWALSQQQSYEEGIGLLDRGWEVYQFAQGQLWGTYFLACKIECQAQNGHHAQARESLAEAFTYLKKSEECCWEAELYRLRGDLLLAQSDDHHSEARICLQQALDIARRQQARALELRAALSMARLCLQRDNAEQGLNILTPVYDGFSEGFETADLQEAKTLIGALAR